VAGDVEVYYLRVEPRMLTEKRARSSAQAIEVYSRYPAHASRYLSIENVVHRLEALGIQDLEILMERCQEQGWMTI